MISNIFYLRCEEIVADPSGIRAELSLMRKQNRPVITNFQIGRSHDIASARLAFNAWLAPLDGGCLFVRTDNWLVILKDV